MVKRVILFGFLLTIIACHHGGLRGSSKKSPDGKTYLIVADDNGGACPVHLDGKLWPHAKGERGSVTPGRHVLSACGSEGIGFDVAAGTTYTFDYWGP